MQWEEKLVFFTDQDFFFASEMEIQIKDILLYFDI